MTQTYTPGPYSDPVPYGSSKFEVQSINGRARQLGVFNTLPDARLYKLAPELVEALKMLNGELGAWCSSGDPRGPDWAERRIIRISKLLAKLDQ